MGIDIPKFSIKLSQFLKLHYLSIKLIILTLSIVTELRSAKCGNKEIDKNFTYLHSGIDLPIYLRIIFGVVVSVEIIEYVHCTAWRTINIGRILCLSLTRLLRAPLVTTATCRGRRRDPLRR